MGLVQKLLDLVALALCWFSKLFARPEPLPRITNFRWVNIYLDEAEATLRFGDGDVRNVYSEDGQWYYFGEVPVDSVRLVHHLMEHQFRERWKMQRRQEAGP